MIYVKINLKAVFKQAVISDWYVFKEALSLFNWNNYYLFQV